jgi:hypothetical protein
MVRSFVHRRLTAGLRRFRSFALHDLTDEVALTYCWRGRVR